MNKPFVCLCLLLLCATPVAHGATPNSVNVLAFGDQGTGDDGQKRVAAALKAHCRRETCDQVLLLGDNFYPAGVQSTRDPQFQTKFEAIYAPLTIPFYPVLGNHDYGEGLRRGNWQAQIDYSAHSRLWKMPARYYRVKTAHSEFFALDTNAFDAVQRAWLARSLAESPARFKIVFGHHPIHSYGQHGDTKELVRSLLPLLCGQASLYLSGHDHDLQVLRADCGLALAVSGAGASARSVRQGARSAFAASTLGYTQVQIVGEQGMLRMHNSEGNVLFEQPLQPIETHSDAQPAGAVDAFN